MSNEDDYAYSQGEHDRMVRARESRERIEALLADRMALRKRVDVLEAALRELKECVEGDIEANKAVYDIPLRRAREALAGKP